MCNGRFMRMVSDRRAGHPYPLNGFDSFLADRKKIPWFKSAPKTSRQSSASAGSGQALSGEREFGAKPGVESREIQRYDRTPQADPIPPRQ